MPWKKYIVKRIIRPFNPKILKELSGKISITPHPIKSQTMNSGAFHNLRESKSGKKIFLALSKGFAINRLVHDTNKVKDISIAGIIRIST